MMIISDRKDQQAIQYWEFNPIGTVQKIKLGNTKYFITPCYSNSKIVVQEITSALEKGETK